MSLPDLPLLKPDPTQAYTTYKPSQATEQALIQPTAEASTPNSPTDTTNTTDTQVTSHIAIQPPPKSPADKAMRRYKADWDQTAEELQRRYPNLQMSEAFRTQATDFITYVTYRATEYYKIFTLSQTFSESTIAVKEAEMLQFIGVDGFNVLINEPKYWELLDAAVKRAYPNAELPARTLSAHEQKMVEQHEAELLVKEQEIANLQEEIRRRTEEVEKIKKKVESLQKDFDNEKSELAGKLEEETK